MADAVNLMNFMDPNALAQNQADLMRWQQNQQLAQGLMQAPILPYASRGGAAAGILTRVLGALQNRQNNAKLSDILKAQFEAQNAAEAAQRKQQLEDELRKMQEDIYKSQMSEKAKRDYAPLQFQGGGSFDPSTGQWNSAPGYMTQQLAQHKQEALDTAAANARYREAPGAGDVAKLGLIQKLMAQPDSPTKQAQLSALLGQGGMEALQMGQMMGAGGGGGTPGVGLSGDDYLKSLPQGVATQVKALAEGRMAFPSGFALRSPYWQNMLQAVSQYDPSFDAVNYGARAKTQKDFATGPQSNDVNALNTALGHVAHLSDLAAALGNSDYPAINKILNSLSVATGGNKVTNFNQARDAVVQEVVRVYRRAGGSESDVSRGIQNLNAASSPEQLQGALATLTSLMGSKLAALQSQYDQGMGVGKKSLLNDDAKKALEKISQRSGGMDLGIDFHGLDMPNPTQAPTSQLSDQELLRKYGGG